MNCALQSYLPWNISPEKYENFIEMASKFSIVEDHISIFKKENPLWKPQSSFVNFEMFFQPDNLE